jgi:protein SCO1/2
MLRLRRLWVLVPPALLVAPGSWAQPSPYDAEAAIAHSQAAIGREVGDLAFTASDGAAVRLADFRGKPLVVNMVFTACAESCPVVVRSLYRAVEVAQDAVGEDGFSVITVGFDTDADSPERMRAYARAQGVDLPNWTFLSGDEASVRALTDSLGFIYFPSPRGFDHLAQTSVVDAEGRVFRQVYGATFAPPALVEPLLTLVYGGDRQVDSVGDVVDRVRLFCTYFDAASGRYRFDYSIVIALAVGTASLGGIAVVLVRAWLRTAPPSTRA